MLRLWKNRGVSIRTIALTLAPTEAQHAAFVTLRRVFVAACNHVSAVAWEAHEFNRARLHAVTR